MNKNFKNMAIGAVASTIASAYYLYGSREGQAARKNMAAWAVKMKGEVLEGLEKLKDVSEPKYKELVKKVSDKYAKVDKTELNKVTAEINAVWSKMKKEVNAEILRRAEQIKKEEAKVNKEVINAGIKKAITKVKAKVTAKKAVKKVMSKKTNTDTPIEVKVESPETNL